MEEFRQQETEADAEERIEAALERRHERAAFRQGLHHVSYEDPDCPKCGGNADQYGQGQVARI